MFAFEVSVPKFAGPVEFLLGFPFGIPETRNPDQLVAINVNTFNQNSYVSNALLNHRYNIPSFNSDGDTVAFEVFIGAVVRF